jgi:starch phosphorylase
MFEQRPRVAYLCMEFGLSEALRIYSGGLGVLAGDFLRSAKALDLPVVGVGIAWGDGYTTQHIDSHGRPVDIGMALDRSFLKRETPIISVPIGERDVPICIHRVDSLENAALYLLEPMDEKDRAFTRRLYGGSAEDRIAQELILGVGAVRALEALGIEVDRYHFNEGHALFAGVELLARHLSTSGSFDEALERVRDQVVFTTHTPVEAGNEQHDLGLLHRLAAHLGFDQAFFERLGGRPFNMTAAALRLSGRANAVAELHGETARRMWSQVEEAAPIVSITNGVDHRVWQDASIRDAVKTSDEKLLAAHQALKGQLIREIDRRSGVELAADRLLLGFARRATSYKRALLFFSDRARAERLLDGRQLQLVYAGKAHPRDNDGANLIADLVSHARRYAGKVVFLKDYDLELGRLLTRGCDVWLNTPRRPLEACGTSGMKAAMNGVLNLSILDGWWPEGCVHGENGWQVGHREPVSPVAGEWIDRADALSLYEVLEGEVLPVYYNAPDRWAQMMRASIGLTKRFSSDRMVRDYFTVLYRARARREDRKRRVASG